MRKIAIELLLALEPGRPYSDQVLNKIWMRPTVIRRRFQKKITRLNGGEEMTRRSQ
jgi:hypothetical protein